MISRISYQQCMCNICGKLTQTHVNLWKSVINDVLNAIINIRLRSIPFLNVLLIWMQSVCNVYRIQTDYVLFNVT